MSGQTRPREQCGQRVVVRSHMPFHSFKRESKATSGPGIDSRPRPKVATYIVGDIHGRVDLLEELLRIIDDDVLAGAYVDPKLVFVGDYIDRGEQCAEVIDRLFHLTMDWPENVTCLMGNHEAMLLSFLDNPLENGRRWFRYGGLQTLASYGVAMTGGAEAPAPGDLLNAAALLRERLGSVLGWLRDLPLTWQSRNLWAVHGAADPREAMERQSRQTLLWGHSEFGRVRRKDGTSRCRMAGAFWWRVRRRCQRSRRWSRHWRNDPGAKQHAGLAGGRRHGHAARFQYSGGTG